MQLAQIGTISYQTAKRLSGKSKGAVLDNLKMGYEKDNEEEPLKSL